LDKVRAGRQVQGQEGIEWVVDGGVTAENLSHIVEAGADTVVVGRAVFSEGKIFENMAALRAAA
jgi:ribulose-phosphate 3-epimerase